MTALNAQPPNLTTSLQDPIKAKIRAFVFEQYPVCQQKNLQDADSLIESGIVDSMGILSLVAFVESDLDVVVEDTDLTPENFESIELLTAFVVAKQNY